MKGFLAAVGVLLVIVAVILSVIGYRHFVVLGIPMGATVIFGLGYVLYRSR